MAFACCAISMRGCLPTTLANTYVTRMHAWTSLMKKLKSVGRGFKENHSRVKVRNVQSAVVTWISKAANNPTKYGGAQANTAYFMVVISNPNQPHWIGEWKCGCSKKCAIFWAAVTLLGTRWSYSSASLCPRLKRSPSLIPVVLFRLCKPEEPLLFCCINPLGVVPSLVQLLSSTMQANHYSFFVFRCCVWIVELTQYFTLTHSGKGNRKET